jgi:hypothetical protein
MRQDTPCATLHASPHELNPALLVHLQVLGDECRDGNFDVWKCTMTMAGASIARMASMASITLLGKTTVSDYIGRRPKNHTLCAFAQVSHAWLFRLVVFGWEFRSASHSFLSTARERFLAFIFLGGITTTVLSSTLQPASFDNSTIITLLFA